MKREIIVLTHFSCILYGLIFLGFIDANEFNIKNLIQSYELFFYFITALSVLVISIGFPEPKHQYTKARFYWEIIANTLLGIMLAYYGYFLCATILTFIGYMISKHNYFTEGKE